MRAGARGTVRVALMFLPLAGCAPAIVAPPPLAPSRAAPRITEGADFGLTGAIVQGGLAIGIAPAGTMALLLDGQSVDVAADGRFLIAFDRDHGPAATLDAVLADGLIQRRTLAVVPRAWAIESLPTLPRGTPRTPEFLARRKLELDRIAAARATGARSDGWRQRFLWPVSGRISGVFGSQRIYAGEPGAYHAGVDIAGPAGTSVVAPADGVVVLATETPFSLEGNLLMIDHGMGLNSAFLHLSRIDVRTGDVVRRGQPVGAIGMSGRATGPHLHWAVRWRDARIDPAPLAGETGSGVVGQ